MRSAILLSTRARSAGEVLPHLLLAAWAASRASSMSSAVERGISQKPLPVTGDTFSKYCSRFGLTNSPPMKFWYRLSKWTSAPSVLGFA